MRKTKAEKVMDRLTGSYVELVTTKQVQFRRRPSYKRWGQYTDEIIRIGISGSSIADTLRLIHKILKELNVYHGPITTKYRKHWTYLLKTWRAKNDNEAKFTGAILCKRRVSHVSQVWLPVPTYNELVP